MSVMLPFRVKSFSNSITNSNHRVTQHVGKAKNTKKELAKCETMTWENHVFVLHICALLCKIEKSKKSSQ